MTELEEQLESPVGESLRQALLQRLGEIGMRLQCALAAGVPRSEFADWQAAADAVTAAREVLVRHPGCPETIDRREQ